MMHEAMHETKVISKKIKMLDLLEVNVNNCTVWVIFLSSDGTWIGDEHARY